MSPLRPFKLSTDLRPCAEILPAAFQYPENPAWSMQGDEQEELVDTLNNLARIWPLLRLLQLVFPPLRDQVRGYVWEEAGQPVGVILFQGKGGAATWFIGQAVVLPTFRRQGIGRSLVQAGLDYIRDRGGKTVLLNVVDGNVPAYNLYRQVGFAPFGSHIAFDYEQSAPLTEPSLPDGYVISPSDYSDPQAMHANYELAKRITPTDIQRYEPVGEPRSPLITRLLVWIARVASGVRAGRMVIHTDPGGQVVGTGDYSARLRPGGVNDIVLLVDPAHAQLAPYLLQHLIRTTQRLSPGRRIAFTVPAWQEAVIEAAAAAGCVKRLEYCRMGLIL